jgi:hypothetical protein
VPLRVRLELDVFHRLAMEPGESRMSDWLLGKSLMFCGGVFEDRWIFCMISSDVTCIYWFDRTEGLVVLIRTGWHFGLWPSH